MKLPAIELLVEFAVILLCPNHHLMLDKGVYMIEDDLSLINIEGSLNKHPDHEISFNIFGITGTCLIKNMMHHGLHLHS